MCGRGADRLGPRRAGAFGAEATFVSGRACLPPGSVYLV